MLKGSDYDHGQRGTDLFQTPDLPTYGVLQILHRPRLYPGDDVVHAVYHVSLLDLNDRVEVLEDIALGTDLSVYQNKSSR